MKDAVSEQELKRVAALAQLALPADRVHALLADVNGILRHVHVLERVHTGDVDAVLGVGAGGMRLRADDGEPYPMTCSPERFAPEVRDGYFLVPRLATHADGAGGDGTAGTSDAATPESA